MNTPSSPYDERGMSDRYTARRHAGTSSPNTVMEEPALLGALGDTAGLDVLDLGCGDADLGRLLLEAGCRSYLGVDSSKSMAERARSTLVGTPGRVVRALMEGFAARPGSVDLVVSRMALHYLPELTPALTRARTWLRPHGRVVFTVPHPVLTCHDARRPDEGPRRGQVVDDYFETGPRERDWMGTRVVWHHRTVEDHVDALTRAGFGLTGLRECAPERQRFGGDTVEYARRLRVPLFLLLAGTRLEDTS
ncbi:class I SAM-dependent methyltransferase [Nocardiopsis sp. NPDC007018]|uniref:class I SAM-dependent methyltransferase n=1 Tax=Nocardiopsis sp. NPDC007018 TaxID=3155721 RepID=UPI0033D3A2CF